ncbi:hypothetical protein BDK51DRAFT_38928 [Blyttiomyces helicus]|uniref:Uncharacterized protein n=1 Tax=Blyttiomyces helicus TaxID=388810 RepID=A0A4P9WL35_9FUNG|nr:hypothetical protein BDK51DRAFT_38928 [Blyttiomyces helicus]|eukprot:RKO91900.1 hypothetical protein BDK51DRAFT_38928 [Blyttiomyces helicus]
MNTNTQSFNHQTTFTKYDNPTPNYKPLSPTPTPVILNNDQLNQALFCVTTAVACRSEENAAYTQQIAKNLLGFVNTETNDLQTRIDQIDKKIRPHDHHKNLTPNVAYIDSRLTTFSKSVEEDIFHSERHIRNVDDHLCALADTVYGLPDDIDLARLMVPCTASTRSTVKKKIAIKIALSFAHYYLPLNMVYKLDSDILIVNKGVNQFTEKVCAKLPAASIGNVVYNAVVLG